MMETSRLTDSKKSLPRALFIIVVSSLFGQTLPQSTEILEALPCLEFSINNRTLSNASPDIASEEIIIQNGFPFGERILTSAYVGDNGVISFDRPFLLTIPEAFPGTVAIDVVAPYWSDNDITSEGSVTYEVFQLGSSSLEDTMLATVSDFINRAFDMSTFQGAYMILAEWNGVHPFPHGNNSVNLSPAQQAITDLTNTYQAILITNHEESYAVFTYKCNQLQWTGLDFSFPTIGYYSVIDGMFDNHPLTGQAFANQVACSPNPDINNVVYRIGRVDQQERRLCLEWYFTDLNIYSSSLITQLDGLIQTCPCSLSQADVDERFVESNTDKTSSCFIQGFPSNGTDGLALRECCYSNDSLTAGALVTDTENGGSLLLSPTPEDSLLQNNRIPQSLCCAPGVGLCDLYYSRRPPNNCTNYEPLSSMGGFGEPHITTFDALTYTFNGIGEYVLVRSVDDDIEYQGRTTLVTNSDATAFSAFVIRHSGITVQVSFTNDDFNVLVDGTDVSVNLMMVGSSIRTSSYVLERLTATSLRLSFSSGVTLTVNIANEIFNFILNLPPLSGQPQGLLGTPNGDNTDDLIYRNGTLLPTTSSDAEKHTFGQSWQVSEEESIFQYAPGENVNTFSDPNHIPPFLDEIRMSLEENSTLTNICGNNTQCLFDFSQTGNEEVGMATMEFEQQVMDEIIMSVSFPPNISAPDTFMATVGIESIYSFTVAGSIDVSVVINGQEVLPSNVVFNENGETFTLTWTPVDVNEEFNLTIIAVAEQDVRGSHVPRVQLCGCVNNGNCTEVGVLNNEMPFVVLDCDCPEAYDGRFCEDDANGCLEISCPDGLSSCMDLEAPAAGAVCACPNGYLLISSKCVDIDECNSTDNCTDLQTCTNTPGGFTCSCQPGYTDSLTSPLRCVDINECDEGLDGCHQICTNTDASFECSCEPAFELLSDNRTCSVRANSTCQPNNNPCQQLCYLDGATIQPVCSCNPGYQLNSDQTTCSDINECDTNNGGCSQNCTNTVGGFTCSCNSNFTLAEDNRTCIDINECEDQMMIPCPNTFLCNNLIGGFECFCPLGAAISPDGQMCEIIVAPSSSSSSSPSMSPSTSILIATTSSIITDDTSVISPTGSITPNVTSEESDDDDGLSGGAIAGIVVGSVLGAALLLAIIVIVALWLNHQRKSDSVDFAPARRSRGISSLRRSQHTASVIAGEDD